MKNLRIENEYYQRQLETLRKEIEYVKTQQRGRSLDRNSKGGSHERGANQNAYFGGG